MTDHPVSDLGPADPAFGPDDFPSTASEAAQNEFLRGRASALDDGLFQLEGGDALAAAAKVDSQLEGLRDQLVERADNDRQRGLLASDLDAHMALAREAIADHVARQTEAWQRAVRSDRIGLLRDQARRDWQEPQKLALYADAAASASDRPADSRSSLWRSAIDAALTAGQHEAALALHGDAQEHLTPADADALKPELAIARQMQAGRAFVDGLLPRPMPGTAVETDAAHGEASQRNAAQWADDPEQQATNQHLIDVAFGTHQRGLDVADAARDQALQDWLARKDAAGNAQTERPPPSLWKQLDIDRRRTIDAQLAANARGEDVLDPPTADEATRQSGDQGDGIDPNVILTAGGDEQRKPRLPGQANRPRGGPEDPFEPKQINPFAGGAGRLGAIPRAAPRSPGQGAKPAGRSESLKTTGAAGSGDKAQKPGEQETLEIDGKILPKPSAIPPAERQPVPLSSFDRETQAGMQGANYAQSTYKEAYGDQGRLNGWTIDDVVKALRRGILSPKDVVVDFVNRDGHWLMHNTRSPQALLRAGIPKSEWYVRDMTGDEETQRRVAKQLGRNRLSSEGTPHVAPGQIKETEQ